MKIRYCFVSNSSSSSFIVSAENKEFAIEKGMKLYQISDIIKKLNQIKEFHIELNEKIASFDLPVDVEDECYDLYTLNNLIKEMNRLNDEYSNSYITSNISDSVMYDEKLVLPVFRSY